MDNVRSVIFDLGRVLIDFDFQISAKEIAALSDKSPDEIYDFFFSSPLTQSFEEGRVSPEDFFSKVKSHLGLKISINEFLPIWNKIFFLTDENNRVYQLSKRLKRHYKIALLSNVNILHFEYLKHNFPIFDTFDPILVSYEIGFVKPSPMIYQKAIDVLGCRPGEIFYTDDRKELIDAAKELGLRGYVYKGCEQLKRDMISCGINL